MGEGLKRAFAAAKRTRKKPLMIFESNLTAMPRYYASTAYREEPVPGSAGQRMRVVITGIKHDVTDQIEAIIAKRSRA
jgi:hypothetical protein